MHLRYYFSYVYGYSSYGDVINDATVTPILFSSFVYSAAIPII